MGISTAQRLEIAIAAAAEVAQERGMGPDRTQRFIAEVVARHHDPDVRALWQRQNNQHRKDLN